MSHKLTAEADFEKQELEIFIDGESVKTLDFSPAQKDPDIYQGSFTFKPDGAKKKINYDVIFERAKKENPKIYIYPVYNDDYIEDKVVEVSRKK